MIVEAPGTALTERLASALRDATRNAIAERDLFMEGHANGFTGVVDDRDAREILAEMDAEIDDWMAILNEAGMPLWPPRPPAGGATA
ncbi:MAG: hypothetical protein OXB97_04555 [Rhodospirillales bacterium]|nr:hypothetical protein [Rhodospirillales bacterium]